MSGRPAQALVSSPSRWELLLALASALAVEQTLVSSSVLGGADGSIALVAKAVRSLPPGPPRRSTGLALGSTRQLKHAPRVSLANVALPNGWVDGLPTRKTNVHFPTSNELSSFFWSLRLQTIRDLILRRDPGLVDQVSCDDLGRMLMVDMPPRGIDPGPRVALGKSRSGLTEHWLMMASTGFEIVSSIWELTTPDDVIAEAVLAMRERCMTGALVSPWRWDEARRSPIVHLADRLTRDGLEVEAVVSENRLSPDSAPAEKASPVPARFGDALRLNLGWGVATVSNKPTLGWVLDASDHLVTRRLDLQRCLTGQPSEIPGIATDDLEPLSAAIKTAVHAGPWDRLEGHIDMARLDWYESRLQHAVAWWMRELGYSRTDVTQLGHGPQVLSSAARVEVCTRETATTLADVQRIFAQAAVDNLRPMIFTISRFTRTAQAWADKANLALFTIWSDKFTLGPASALAEEHIPTIV